MAQWMLILLIVEFFLLGCYALIKNELALALYGFCAAGINLAVLFGV